MSRSGGILYKRRHGICAAFLCHGESGAKSVENAETPRQNTRHIHLFHDPVQILLTFFGKCGKVK